MLNVDFENYVICMLSWFNMRLNNKDKYWKVENFCLIVGRLRFFCYWWVVILVFWYERNWGEYKLFVGSEVGVNSVGIFFIIIIYG